MLAPTNLRDVCESVIEETVPRVPVSILKWPLTGNWDSVKLGQVVSNLVANAIGHGAQRERVALTVRGEDDRLSVAVHNEGAPITAKTLENIGCVGRDTIRRRPASTGKSLTRYRSASVPLPVEDRALPGHWEGDLLFVARQSDRDAG